MRILVACLPLLAAAPALAADPAKPARDPDKVICKRIVPVGSLIASKKECRTRAEWDAVRRDAQDDTQRLQSMAPTNGPG